MKIVRTTFSVITVLLLITIALLFFIPLLPIPGNIEIKIVKSGSMTPAVKTGSIVVIKPRATYEVGDIITFGKNTPTSHPTTHRIVSADESGGTMEYFTKGDANEEIDLVPTKKGAVIGRVIATIPLVGYILDFARQPVGFILLIAFPATLVVFYEFIDIVREVRKLFSRRRFEVRSKLRLTTESSAQKKLQRVHRTDDILRPVYFVKAHEFSSGRTRHNAKGPLSATLILILISGIAFGFKSSTISYFADRERSVGNTVAATYFDLSASAEPSEVYVGETENAVILSTITPNAESFSPEYTVSMKKKNDSDAFCEALVMTSTTTPPFYYEGSLLDFTSPPTTFTGTWQFEISRAPDTRESKAGHTCTVELAYAAWNQGGHDGKGYSDDEKVVIVFEANADEPDAYSIASAYSSSPDSNTASSTPLSEEQKTPEPPSPPTAEFSDSSVQDQGEPELVTSPPENEVENQASEDETSTASEPSSESNSTTLKNGDPPTEIKEQSPAPDDIPASALNSEEISGAETEIPL